jgi:hypothetical protein
MSNVLTLASSASCSIAKGPEDLPTAVNASQKPEPVYLHNSFLV